MDLTYPAPLSLPAMIQNLLLGLLLSTLLAAYYARFGDSLSNRSKFAPILPVLSLITLLVITIVKSSLALSLGLVGALSIVRFRTAIKDPEELIFLFLAVAIGLGLGADQRVPTLIAFIAIILYLFTRKLLSQSLRLKPYSNLYLNISIPDAEDEEAALAFVNALLAEELEQVDLRRANTNDKQMQLVFYIKTWTADAVMRVSQKIRAKYAHTTISVVEQDNLLGG